MNYLLVVDLQTEFAKGFEGKAVYERCLDFIQRAHPMYTIVAPIYINKTNPNMHRLVSWNEMKDIKPLEFHADYIYAHSGYSIKEYPAFNHGDHVDVIGFDTDACVLSACFDLFNLGVDFRILVNGCWSSGGRGMHNAALKIMDRQFGRAVDRVTRLEDLYGNGR